MLAAALVVLALTLPARAPAADAHHPHAEAATPLSLDHGQKWAADRHTMDSVASMRSIVAKVPPSPAAVSIEELQATGKQLQDGLQTLIRGCTMTGPAHEQLHAWISAVAPEIEALTRSQQVEAGRASLGRIDQLLRTFDAHFEMKSGH